MAGFLWWQGDRTATTRRTQPCTGRTSHSCSRHSARVQRAKAKMVVATLGQTDKDEATGNEK